MVTDGEGAGDLGGCVLGACPETPQCDSDMVCEEAYRRQADIFRRNAPSPEPPGGLLHYWDRYGRPLDLWGWAARFEDFNYRLVGRTDFGAYWVSTVWLGHDLSFGQTPYPLIFESMVFAQGTVHDMDCRRYRTLADAEAGHEELVTLLRATTMDVETVLDEDSPARKEDT